MKKLDINNLFKSAEEASKKSYSPYSNYPVGAAVLTEKGKIFTGVNVENVSYGLTICAERSAICNAVSAGFKNIKSIAVYAQKGDASPCGACRQFILEFGENIDVIYKKNNQLIVKKINDLIPDGFTKTSS